MGSPGGLLRGLSLESWVRVEGTSRMTTPPPLMDQRGHYYASWGQHCTHLRSSLSGDSPLCDAVFRHDVSWSRGDRPGSPSLEETPEVVYSPAHRPCASEETHGVHSSFRGFGFNLLEKSPRLVSGGAPEQSDATHRSVHRRISRRLRNVHVAGRGGTVAGSYVSPYKRAGITLRMESNPAFFRPVAVQSTCVDSNRQQSSGGLHKSPGRCTISAAASHTRASYTAKWTAFHLVCREKPGPHYGHPASHAVVPPAVTGQELAYGTVKTYAAAISSCHIGFGDRDSDLCHALWRLNGIWRWCYAH